MIENKQTGDKNENKTSSAGRKNSSQIALADLHDVIEQKRKENMSFRALAKLLVETFEIKVSEGSIRNYCKESGITEANKAPSFWYNPNSKMDVIGGSQKNKQATKSDFEAKLNTRT